VENPWNFGIVSPDQWATFPSHGRGRRFNPYSAHHSCSGVFGTARVRASLGSTRPMTINSNQSATASALRPAIRSARRGATGRCSAPSKLCAAARAELRHLGHQAGRNALLVGDRRAAQHEGIAHAGGALLRGVPDLGRRRCRQHGEEQPNRPQHSMTGLHRMISLEATPPLTMTTELWGAACGRRCDGHHKKSLLAATARRRRGRAAKQNRAKSGVGLPRRLSRQGIGSIGVADVLVSQPIPIRRNVPTGFHPGSDP
jgi:hypothetical protein